MALGYNDISVTLVRNTLSYNSFDVGTLCSCPNVNKWSKYKPVCGGIDAWGNTGFTKDASIGDISVKQYQPPTGGADNPYVLGHFRGYDHSASEPSVSLAGENTAYVKPNGTRAIMVKYKSSGLDFRKEGYNQIIIRQEMPGGGYSVVGSMSLNELVLNSDNYIDAMVSGAGLLAGQTYTRSLIISFGTNGVPYRSIGYNESHFKVDVKIVCTADGNPPPTVPTLGIMKVSLVGAPASITNCVTHVEIENVIVNNVRMFKMINIAWGEDTQPSSSDISTFKSGAIDIWVSKNGIFYRELNGLKNSAQYSPATGAAFAVMSGTSIVNQVLSFPSLGQTYTYEARWSK